VLSSAVFPTGAPGCPCVRAWCRCLLHSRCTAALAYTYVSTACALCRRCRDFEAQAAAVLFHRAPAAIFPRWNLHCTSTAHCSCPHGARGEERVCDFVVQRVISCQCHLAAAGCDALSVTHLAADSLKSRAPDAGTALRRGRPIDEHGSSHRRHRRSMAGRRAAWAVLVQQAWRYCPAST